MSGRPVLVSVVVPTHNREALLADCLASLRRQDYPPEAFEIVVVDDGSTDATPAVVRRLQEGGPPAIRYLRQEARGPNAARNAGIGLAGGDPICLIDDDVEVPPGWLGALVQGLLRHPEAGAAGGRIRLRLEGRAPRRCGREPWVGEAEFDPAPGEQVVREVISANMAIRRWAVSTVGGFDESLPLYGDEIEWQRRLGAAGHPILYVPTAALWHRRAADDLRKARLLRRYVRRGAGHVALARRLGDRVSAGAALRRLALSLAHAVRRGCFLGLLVGAQQAGILLALTRERLGRGRRTPP